MGTGKAILVVLCVLQLTFCMAAFGSAASAATPASGDNDIAQTVKALKEAKLLEDDPIDVPTDVGMLLTKLKHQLRDMVQAALASYDGSGSTRTVEQVVQNSLGKQGVGYGDGGFGFIYPVSVRKVKGHNDIVAVTTTIGITCGSDSSLYIFKKKGQGWNLVLADETEEYEDVSGGRENFEYYVSPPAKTGRFFVVTKDHNTGCTSYWKRLQCRVLRPAAEPYKSQVLLARKTSIVLWEDGGKLTGRPDGFRMDFLGAVSLQPDDIARKHVESYHVSGDRVVRVPPLAKKPQDFLDEWVELEWKEAVQWVLPPVPENVRKWHERLGRCAGNRPLAYYTFSPPAVELEKGVWEIGLELDPPILNGTADLVFTVVMKKGVYYVKSAVEGTADKGQ